MVLDEYVRDYRAFMDEFASVLDASETVFYLDTSLLIWLIRLGAEARKEVIRWLRNRPKGSVCVPVWTAHELHRHIVDATARKNLRETVKDVLSKYDDFVRMASERADDMICVSKGFPDRAFFLRELELSFTKTHHLAQVADLDDTALQLATKAVIDFANENLLETDLTSIFEKLNFVGDFRVTHLLPPGFQDRKSENSYGDIIIWHEIIQHLRVPGDEGATPRDVVFISRDQKTDWVSRAPFVLNLRGETIKGAPDQEMDVTRAHPFLVHELTGIARGKRLYITHPAFLASVIDFTYRRKDQTTQVACWLAGSHRPDLLEKLAAKGLPAASTPPPSESKSPASSKGPATPSVPIRDSLESISLKDLESSVRGDVGAYIKALPIEQEQLMESWIASACNGSLTPVRIGRIFADIVLSGVAGFDIRIPAIVESLLSATDSYRVNVLVLAMMVAAYFDRYSELLRAPVASLGDVLISLEAQERLKPSFNALARFLKDADAELPYVPGSGKSEVAFVLDIAEGIPGGRRPIRDIRVGQQSALLQPIAEESRRNLSRLLGRTREMGCTGKDIRLMISREFQIPPDRLTTNYDGKKVTWPTDAGLVALSMSSPGGVSAAADEENE